MNIFKEILHIPTEKVDIYSIGAILFELFTNVAFQPIFHLYFYSLINLPIELRELIGRCLEMDPEKRPTLSYISGKLVEMKNNESPSVAKAKIIDLGESNLIEEHFHLKEINPFNETNSNIAVILKNKDPIGGGKFGKVFLLETNYYEGKTHKFALKVIKREVFDNSSKKTRDLILNEIDILYNLSKLKYFIHFMDAFFANKSLYIVIEYCNGGDLDKRICTFSKKNKFLSFDEIIFILWQLAKGFFVLHSKNCFHRDLKPENILLIIDKLNNDICDIRICDFGLSRALNKDDSEIHKTDVGTNMYKAPEIKEQKGHWTNFADVYSFGVVMYYLLTKKKPDKNPLDCSLLESEKGEINSNKIEEQLRKQLNELCKLCTKENENERPQFHQILSHSAFSIFDFKDITKKYILKNEPKFKTHNLRIYEDDSQENMIYIFNNRLTNDETFLNLLLKKYVILLLTSDIENSFKIKECGYFQNCLAFVFENYTGLDLLDIFCQRSKEREGPPFFDESEILSIYNGLEHYLQHLHQNNFLHRRLNPKCIFAKIKDNKVSDIKVNLISLFILNSDNDKNLDSIGYNDFLFYPYRNEKELTYYHEGCDFFSLGIILYFLYLGRFPFKDDKDWIEFKEKGDHYFKLKPEESAMDKIILFHLNLDNIPKKEK